MTGAVLKTVRAERLWGFDFLLFRMKELTFYQRHGRIRHANIAGLTRQTRLRYLASEMPVCEIKNCVVAGAHGPVIVFDHCHRHGWVRGLVCTTHNRIIGKVEAVMQIDGVRVDLGETFLADWLTRCPDC